MGIFPPFPQLSIVLGGRLTLPCGPWGGVGCTACGSFLWGDFCLVFALDGGVWLGCVFCLLLREACFTTRHRSLFCGLRFLDFSPPHPTRAQHSHNHKPPTRRFPLLWCCWLVRLCFFFAFFFVVPARLVVVGRTLFCVFRLGGLASSLRGFGFVLFFLGLQGVLVLLLVGCVVLSCLLVLLSIWRWLV